MKTFLFTVFDVCAGAFLEPFSAPSVEFAIRSFRQAVNTPEHAFHTHATDYTLFVIGEFDAISGKLIPQEPASLGIGITFLEETPLESAKRVVSVDNLRDALPLQHDDGSVSNA